MHPSLAWFLALALAPCAAGAYGAADMAASRPAVVELFTSQGCSSCPPADALLGELAQRGDVLALAFHVDYWDSLGWRDGFALPLSAQRQQNYVTSLGLPSAFTPQVIIDGERSALGSDRAFIQATLRTPRPGIPLALSMSGGSIHVALAAAEGVQGTLELVTFRPAAETAIARGENARRTLHEYNIVRSLRELATWHGEALDLNVPVASLPADASRVALLVRRRPQGSIVAAASLAYR